MRSDFFRLPGRLAVTGDTVLMAGDEDRFSVGYARVSGSDQKSDLARQKAFLSPHCDEVIGDVGSGLNCNKPGLKKLLNLSLNRKIKILHLAYKDRLLRF